MFTLGDFEAVERIIQLATDEDMFLDHIQNAPYKAVWKRIYATDASI